jgi:hypothetical protein
MPNFNFKPVEDTLELLKNLCSLESLEVVENRSKAAFMTGPDEDYVVRDAFVQAMIGSGVWNDAPILPVLQHLTLEAQGSHLSDKALVGLVRSRWGPLTSEPNADSDVTDSVTSLLSIRFILTKRRCDATVLQPLVDMAAAGLKVTVIDSFGRVI